MRCFRFARNSNVVNHVLGVCHYYGSSLMRGQDLADRSPFPRIPLGLERMLNPNQQVIGEYADKQMSLGAFGILMIYGAKTQIGFQITKS